MDFQLTEIMLTGQGDLPTLTAARRAARDGFESKKNLSLDSKEASEGIQHAENVSKVLRENVVQGQAIDGKENSYSELLFCNTTILFCW